MRRGTFVRWGVPIAAAAVIGAAIGAGPVIAAVSGEPTLPERSAQQLLADAVAATGKEGGIAPMSGTVQQTASLGLPALPQTGEASPLSLLSGSHEVKVWYGGADKVRVALPTQLNETNLIVNGDTAWYWESATNTATKLTIKAEAGQDKRALPTPRPTDVTPQQVAEHLLANVDQHTAVRVINTAQVAGRPVYQLVLAPKDAGSLVQEIRIALDGETYVPLQVQVYAKGSAEPAFQVGFTQVTFTPPAAENFTFTPPAGAKVEEKTLGAGMEQDVAADRAEHAKDVAERAKVVGQGWTTVAVVPFSLSDLKTATPSDGREGPSHGQGPGGGAGADPSALVDSVLKSATPVSGTWGSGKLIKTKLVTALLTDDGRLLVGAVTPEEITKAAGTK
ncbi:LolA family protein [Nonomuraea jabiensis]|uniref:LolA family protein n=1 Tax=Nonomuraea jabiensis TaxID=882448 RepID=UPI003D70A7C2